MILLISFSGFSATFEAKDIESEMEVVTDIGEPSTVAKLQEVDVPLEMFIEANLNSELTYSKNVKSILNLAPLTLNKVRDIGWLFNINLYNSKANTKELFNRSDHPKVMLQIDKYISKNIPAELQWFSYQLYSCRCPLNL